MVAGGERGGKSFGAALFLLTRLPWGNKFWIVGPDFKQARKEYEYVVDWVGSKGGVLKDHRPDNGPWMAVFKGGKTLETRSADNPQSLSAESVDGIILSEAAQTNLEIFQRCYGRVAESRGWLLACGTFEDGKYWYEEKFLELEKEGAAFSWPSWLNTKRYPGGFDFFCEHKDGCKCSREMVSIYRMYGPKMFSRRIGGRVVQDEAIVYDCWNQSMVTNPPKTELRIAGVDYGFGDPCVIEVFGLSMPQWYGLDEFYASHYTALKLRPVFDTLREKWNVSTFYVPHDKPEVAVEYYQLCEADGTPDNERCVFIQNGDFKDVARGISYVYSLKETGRLFYDPGQVNLIREQRLYAYPSKESRNRGEKPVKLNDHCNDAERLAMMGIRSHYQTEFMEMEKHLAQNESFRKHPRALAHMFFGANIETDDDERRDW